VAQSGAEFDGLVLARTIGMICNLAGVPTALLLMVSLGACSSDGTRRAGSRDAGAEHLMHDASASVDAHSESDDAEIVPRDSSVRCAQSDPLGAAGSVLVSGCPCEREDYTYFCCDQESAFSCTAGVWTFGIDGCLPLPPCSEDDAGVSCPDAGYVNVECRDR
jgi:hypothetical protein